MILKRVKNSIIARIQNYQSKHFEKTKYGKCLSKLKNSYKGKSCFIIGNGPSLTPNDLYGLEKAGIPCFASNNIIKMFDKTSWRPNFYVCEDLLVLKDLKNKITNIKVKHRFIPINYHWFDNINISGAEYFYQSFQNEENKYLFSDDCSKHIRCTGTVTITCMQLAAYMGFKEIYLLGIDHNYRVTQDSNGNIITDETVKDYFDQSYAETMKDKNIPNLEKTTKAYESAKKFFENKDIKIYNATRGGKLEVYTRVNFDEIVKEV